MRVDRKLQVRIKLLSFYYKLPEAARVPQVDSHTPTKVFRRTQPEKHSIIVIKKTAQQEPDPNAQHHPIRNQDIEFHLKTTNPRIKTIITQTRSRKPTTFPQPEQAQAMLVWKVLIVYEGLCILPAFVFGLEGSPRDIC